MVKDECRYLREWVAFHRTQGYTKFYIYDNNSVVPVADILKDEILNGIVDVTLWTDINIGRHVRAMNHCLNRTDIKTTWLSLTDIDEFIYGENETVCEFLKKHEDLNHLKFVWRGFGSDGNKYRPSGLVIESYTKRGDFKDLPGGKSIVKFNKIKCMKDPHNPMGVKANLFSDEIFINHYVTRSLEDWTEKCIKGGGNGLVRKMETFNEVQKKLNKYTDINILKYLKETQEFLK